VNKPQRIQKPSIDSSKAPKKNHHNQTTNHNNIKQTKVTINQKSKIVLQNVPKQNNKPIINNSLTNLIRQTCMKLLCKENYQNK
jgi:hypothetical protein